MSGTFPADEKLEQAARLWEAVKRAAEAFNRSLYGDDPSQVEETDPPR